MNTKQVTKQVSRAGYDLHGVVITGNGHILEYWLPLKKTAASSVGKSIKGFSLARIDSENEVAVYQKYYDDFDANAMSDVINELMPLSKFPDEPRRIMAFPNEKKYLTYFPNTGGGKLLTYVVMGRELLTEITFEIDLLTD